MKNDKNLRFYRMRRENTLSKLSMNRRRERSEQHRKAVANRIVELYASEQIQEYNFKLLVEAGVVVCEPIKMILHKETEDD